MPAPITTDYIFCNTPGEAWAAYCVAVAPAIFSVTSEGGLTVTPSVVSYSGLWTLRLFETDGTLPSEQLFVMLESPDDNAMSMRDLLTSPGFQASMAFYDVLDPGIMPYVDAWNTLVRDFKKDVIETLTAASVDTPITKTATIISGYIETSTSVLVCQEPALAAVTGDVLRVTYDALKPSAHIIRTHDATISPPGAGGLGVNLWPLVSAVDAITNQDIEISMNQGAFVYSVKAKVAVTSPGP